MEDIDEVNDSKGAKQKIPHVGAEESKTEDTSRKFFHCCTERFPLLGLDFFLSHP